MPAVVLLIILILVVLFVAKTVYDTQQAREGVGRVRVSDPPQPAPRSHRPRRRRPVVDEQELADHVAKLRKAVAADLITREEAVASIVRQSDGALSEEAAGQLLNTRDAA